MDIGSGRDVQDEEMEADNHNKDRWAQALVNKMTAVTTAFRGAGDQRHAARRTYLQMAPDARTESYLEVIDEVLYQSTALNRLTRNARMAVARRAHVVEFLPGETLCVRGSPQDALLVVMSGEVEVVDGHWDGTCPPPPQEHGRFGGLSHEATGYHTATYQHFPPQQQQYMVASPPQSSPSSQHPSRRHLAEQLSVSSGASLTSGIVSGPQPPATPLPLQLDSRHTIHPALQSHPSAHRRHVHNHFRPHSKTGARGGAPRCSGAGGTDGSNSAAGARSRVVLRRGDSLGAVDLGWLSRLPRSSAAATLEELPAAPSLTSRALLATRAEMASGGSISGQAAPGTNGGLAGLGAAGIGGSMLRSLAGGPGSGAVGSSGGRRRSSSTGVPPLLGAGSASGVAESGAGGDEAEGSGEREDGVNKGGSSTAGGRGEREGSIHGSNSDPLQRLRWACTAVAVGGRVECAAIGLQQLCAVVATEMHWDVESLVESLEELPVFAALSGVELRQLVRVLRLHTFSGGTVVYKQGTVGNDLYIIRSGCVRLLKQVALDDSSRNRLNRISAELSAVRDQTAAAAALLHGQQGTSVAPFGSSSGYSPAAGPGAPLSTRSAAAASLSGSVSTPVSPGRVRRLSNGQGIPGSGGWYGATGRSSNGPPGSPRADGLITSLSAATGVQNLIARGPSPSPASAPILSLRDRTPHRPGRGGSRGRSASASQPAPQQQLPSPPGSRPASSSGPLIHGTTLRLPECPVRAHCGGNKDQQHAISSGPGPVDAMSGRRHSTSAPVVPNSPVGHPPATPQMFAQHSPNQYSPQYGQGGGGWPGGGGSGGGAAPGPPSWLQHRHRRRSSHVTADELLDRFGVVPRALGERTEALYEDVVMPGPMSGHASTAAATAAAGQDGRVSPSGSSSDSEDCSGAAPGSPVGLPPVIGSRSPSMTQLQGGWAAAATAAVGGSGGGSPAAALPVWQARAPRPLGQGQELVFVELGVLTAGQCFGEVRSDGVAMRTSSAVCDTRTEVLAISRNELHQRMGGRVFEYLWNQVPNDGPQASLDPAMEAGQCAQQLERSMQWTLFKQKLVADVITQKEQRRRTALKCR